MFRNIKFDVFQKIRIEHNKYIIGYIYRFRVLYIKRLYDKKVSKIENLYFDGFDEMKEYVKNNINKCVFVEDIDNDYIHMLKRILKD